MQNSPHVLLILELCEDELSSIRLLIPSLANPENFLMALLISPLHNGTNHIFVILPSTQEKPFHAKFSISNSIFKTFLFD
jgi:hypothetical protein